MGLRRHSENRQRAREWINSRGGRRDIFSEAAARLGIRPTIVEKDFWVCIALKFLFEKSRFGKSLVFKVGTSLSKAHGLIERFSEDIDLVLDWNLLGFGDGRRDPMQDFASKGKQDQFNKEINRLAADYISKTICPELQHLLLKENVGLSAAVDPDDPSRVRVSALADPKLLHDVVAFKRRFYPSAWARYDLAFPGSLKLLPPTPSHVKHLARDYQEMQVMLFGTPPEFRDILDEVKSLEAEINTTARRSL